MHITRQLRVWIVILVFAFLVSAFKSICYSQVHIRERVEIVNQLQPVSAGSNDRARGDITLFHVIRVEVSWNEPAITDVRAVIEAPCTSQVVLYSSTSPISYSFVAPCPGGYSISPQACGPPAPGVDVTFSSRLFLNDSLITQNDVATHLTGCCPPGYCVFSGVGYNYAPPPHVRFEVVAEDDTIRSGQTTRLDVLALDSGDRGVWIDPTTLLEYSIQPDTLGRFITAAGDTVPSPLGDVTYSDAHAGHIRFLAGVIPPGPPRQVTIEVVQMSDTTKRGSDTVWVKEATVTVLPPNLSAMDGMTDLPYELQIYPPEIPVTSFSWSWKPKDTPAGNDPFVRFSPDSTHQSVTVDTAKWYAFPDDTCNCKDTSTYVIRAEAVVNSVVYSDSTELAVWIPDTAAGTFPVFIRGTPLKATNSVTGQVRMYSPGTLTRVPDSVIYFIPSTSQFYPKVSTHENVHVQQQTSGIASNIMVVSSLWEKIQDKVAFSEEGLARTVNPIVEKFVKVESEKLEALRRDMEIGAFNVSDPIPPRYKYQRRCTPYK